jgi:hypothetical protein
LPTAASILWWALPRNRPGREAHGVPLGRPPGATVAPNPAGGVRFGRYGLRREWRGVDGKNAGGGAACASSSWSCSWW